MYCSNCGKEIDDSISVCPNCGKAVLKVDYSHIINILSWAFCILFCIRAIYCFWYLYGFISIILPIILAAILCPPVSEEIRNNAPQIKDFEKIRVITIIMLVILIFSFEFENKSIKGESPYTTNNYGNTTYSRNRDSYMDDYYKEKIESSKNKYNMAIQARNNIDAYMSASEVAHGYFNLNDNENYQKWEKLKQQAYNNAFKF